MWSRTVLAAFGAASVALAAGRSGDDPLAKVAGGQAARGDMHGSELGLTAIPD